jgi:hypothetical protein
MSIKIKDENGNFIDIAGLYVFDNTPIANSSNPVTSGGVYAALQNFTLPTDPTPTKDSVKFLTSGSIYTALGNKSYITWSNAPAENGADGFTNGGAYTLNASILSAVADNYVTKTNANETYATKSQVSGFITGQDATATFASKSELYAYKSEVSNTYVTNSGMSSAMSSMSQSLGQAINTKQSKITISASLTIPSADWANNEVTVSYSHSITTRNEIDIPTDEFTTWGEKGVYAYSETATGIVFKCSEVPTTDLHFKVTSMEVTNAS